MTTPICTIDATGIHRPAFADVLAWAIAEFRTIYGSDTTLDSSTKDGQWVGILATAVDDGNAMAVQVYNSRSPTSAQGVGLSSIVKINGIEREIPSFSTVPMAVTGDVGFPIVNGKIADDAGFIWDLPASVVIAPSGQTDTTATCETIGAITAPIGTVRTIQNTQPGWQTAINTAAATPGSPVEQDPQLRVRQSNSTMNSSTAIADGIQGALIALPGVARAKVYSNEGDLPDENSIPGHCIAAVVDGGNSTAIATVIRNKKGGCGTYGSSIIVIMDTFGFGVRVAYFPIERPVITVAIEINQLETFTTDVIALIQNSVAGWISTRGIGAMVQYRRAQAAAYLFGATAGQTFEIVSLSLARDGNVPVEADVPMAFFEGASCISTNVSVTVLN